MIALKSYGIDAGSADGQAMATSFGTMVGTLGTVLFYGTATINLVWQHMGWRAVEKGNFNKLYVVNMGLPWISHILCSFIPTLIMCKMGAPMVELIKNYLPMDGIAMMTLFTVGSLLPCVGIAILLKQIATKAVEWVSSLSKNHEELADAVRESYNEYEGLTSEIESINTELEETGRRRNRPDPHVPERQRSLRSDARADCLFGRAPPHARRSGRSGLPDSAGGRLPRECR